MHLIIILRTKKADKKTLQKRYSIRLLLNIVTYELYLLGKNCCHWHTLAVVIYVCILEKKSHFKKFRNAMPVIKPTHVHGSLEIQLIYGCETRVRYLEWIVFYRI